MSRESIRELKRQVQAGCCTSATRELRNKAAAAALVLLERSVRMRHCRLAVQRLNAAVTLGAAIPAEYWVYCRKAVGVSRDSKLVVLFLQAEHMLRHQLDVVAPSVI
jgi:hypothetical protein